MRKTNSDIKAILINAFFYLEINGYQEQEILYFKNQLLRFPVLWKFALNFYKNLCVDTHKLYLILLSAERN